METEMTNELNSQADDTWWSGTPYITKLRGAPYCVAT